MQRQAPVVASFFAVLVQISLLDIVFSLDSVITAVGMVDEIAIMIIAVVLAVIVMMVFAGPVSGFVERHPTIKMLSAELSSSYRHESRRRRSRLSHSEGLHLFRDGVRAVRGNAEL